MVNARNCITWLLLSFWTLSIVQISTNRNRNVSETDPVSETLRFLFVEIRMMDKVQKLCSNECYTPSSEPFRMYLYYLDKTCTNVTFYTTNPTWPELGLNLGHCDEKPATKSLSSGMDMTPCNVTEMY
jgi:hypothetical protein